MRTTLWSWSLVALLSGSACHSKVDDGKAAAVQDAKAGARTPPKGKPHALDVGRSRVGFVGAKITDDHEGSFGEFSGTATVDGDTPTGIDVTVQTASIAAEPERLRNHLASNDFFAVEQFPTASFASRSIVAKADGANTHVVEGDLTLRGKTKTVSFPAAITVSATEVRGKAEFSINRKDFDIVYAGMPDDLIKDEVLLQLELVAPRG